MFSQKEKDRRVAAAQKRIEQAADRIEKHEAKAEEAKAARATAEGELAWLEAMPTQPEDTNPTLFGGEA